MLANTFPSVCDPTNRCYSVKSINQSIISSHLSREEMILPETIVDSMRQKHCSHIFRLITEVTETQEKLSDTTEIANTGSFIK